MTTEPARGVRLRLTASVMMLFPLVPAAPAAPGVPAVVLARRADPLTISVPDSVNLGAAQPGGVLTVTLSAMTVSDSRTGIPPWTATVAATDFTTGGTPAQTIPSGSVFYWSGPATAASGGGLRTPGQLTAASRVALSAQVTAFSGRKGSLAAQTTSWRPTLVVLVPSSATTGDYTGTLTHSVA
ncbi:hypothetical protein AB0L05_26920 [Nonomuraea pusilla]|uniref:hypothetical protein n=1 Tax=Nonomuraea pusilla TaxID=46177 RepID=UPI00332BCE1C